MSHRSAIDELADYIDNNEVQESIENMTQSMQRHELIGRVSVPISSSESRSPDIDDFFGRLKQTETFRRRIHRNLRRNFHRDCDSNLIDLFEATSIEYGIPPPPPPLLQHPKAAEVFYTKLNSIEETSLRNSFELKQLGENIGPVLSAPIASVTFDESVCEITSTIPPLGRSERSLAVQLNPLNSDLMIALCKRRRQKQDHDLSYLLGLDVDDDDSQETGGMRSSS